MKRTIDTCTIETPLGSAVLAANENRLVGFWFIGQAYFPGQTEAWTENPDAAIFTRVRQWVAEYFAGKNPKLDFELAPEGTPFQKEVWEILLQIPYGKLVTYGEIAKQLAEKRGLASMSAQAVGGAVGHNRISVMIPCHRVVGANGSLTGYAGGMDKKKALLDLEGAVYKR